MKPKKERFGERSVHESQQLAWVDFSVSLKVTRRAGHNFGFWLRWKKKDVAGGGMAMHGGRVENFSRSVVDADAMQRIRVQAIDTRGSVLQWAACQIYT